MADTQIACEVLKRRNAAYPFNSLFCFKQTGTSSFKTKRGTYVLDMEEIGLGVAYFSHAGAPTSVLARHQPSAGNRAPLAAAIAVPLGPLGVGRLLPGHGVIVRGTHIVCVAVTPAGYRGVGLACSEPRSGRSVPLPGSYEAVMTDQQLAVGRFDDSLKVHIVAIFTETGG